ncbi:Hsp20/alpha crystallin family protein [Heyndrickxia sp. NPDC080065]|uniref:Hsp20/alpha crystallin family protein n=1 Tax=Heyndrickxia sp. NPDC080065 TaxID=3390568 RepID=UPI003D088CBC
MDFDKLKEWMEISQKYQNGNFWDMIFDQANLENFMKDTRNEAPSQKVHTSNSFPLVDIYLTNTQVIVIIELPGYRKEDVTLSLSGNLLSIKGTSKLPIANPVVIRNERRYGDFERLIELPEPTKSNEIHARFESGLLIVTYMRKYTPEENIPIT